MCHRGGDRETTQSPKNTPCVSQCPEIAVIGVTVKGFVSAGEQFPLRMIPLCFLQEDDSNVHPELVEKSL